MGVVYSPESAYLKALKAWDKPYKFEPYPTMMYRAFELPDGRIIAHDPRSTSEADAFNRGCQKEAGSEAEHSRLWEQGYRDSPDEAVAVVKARKRDESTAEAERFAAEARMSEKAQAEARRRDAKESDGSHLPELTPEPTRKPTETVTFCAATKANGQPCTTKAKAGSDFCGRHGKKSA